MSFNITRLRYSEIISGQFFVKSNSNLILSYPFAKKGWKRGFGSHNCIKMYTLLIIKLIEFIEHISCLCLMYT